MKDMYMIERTMRNVKISEETHEKFKQFCKKNCLKMSSLLDKLCIDYMEREDAKRNFKKEHEG
jgi:hypothetical protein